MTRLGGPDGPGQWEQYVPGWNNAQVQPFPQERQNAVPQQRSLTSNVQNTFRRFSPGDAANLAQRFPGSNGPAQPAADPVPLYSGPAYQTPPAANPPIQHGVRFQGVPSAQTTFDLQMRHAVAYWDRHIAPALSFSQNLMQRRAFIQDREFKLRAILPFVDVDVGTENKRRRNASLALMNPTEETAYREERLALGLMAADREKGRSITATLQTIATSFPLGSPEYYEQRLAQAAGGNGWLLGNF